MWFMVHGWTKKHNSLFWFIYLVVHGSCGTLKEAVYCMIVPLSKFGSWFMWTFKEAVHCMVVHRSQFGSGIWQFMVHDWYHSTYIMYTLPVGSKLVLREPRTPNRDVRPFDAFLERFGPFESVNGGFGGSRTCSINSKFAQKSPTFPFVLMKS